MAARLKDMFYLIAATQNQNTMPAIKKGIIMEIDI